MTQEFKLTSEFSPAGDQPQAIEKLVRAYNDNAGYACLMGVTGSGKTFTVANVIERLKKPTLVISHNKTLAAQLYEEFRELFPHNAVEYFVSYYDYYQPEAYIPQRDIYIEKDASRNDDLDRLRLRTTSSLSSRKDVIIVASVSCIFGLGSPEDYKASMLSLAVGEEIERDKLLRRFVDLQYARNNTDLKRATFRVRGDVVEVYPAYEQFAYRIEMFGDEVDRLDLINPTSGEVLANEDRIFIFPAVHYVMPEDRIETAIASISAELDQRLIELRQKGKLLEAQRLAARTKYDMEMIKEVGYCSGIENYSRHLTGAPPGAKPSTLINYFPDDFHLIIDESHVTIPQIRAMFAGDRSRKQVLVDHGFRLPSAMDNRPLRFEEFEESMHHVTFMSATPGPYELEKCKGEVVEQVIRPTGLIDPPIEVLPARGQVPDLIQRVAQRAAAKESVLITTLTKRLAEDLSDYLKREGLRAEYLHSEIDTLDRVKILKALQAGEFDALVGVNLLREGLDLPQVSLVAILDADKEGFLRSESSLIQMIGRTARNVNAEVILYADKVTPSMQRAMDETNRRRAIQLAYNEEHGITPTTIRKEVRSGLETVLSARKVAAEAVKQSAAQLDRSEAIEMLKAQMLEAAEQLDFERAAKLRDRMEEIKADNSTETVPETSLDVDTAPLRPKSTGRKGRRFS
ncbi:MAG TPA: excinuclease ABC subunit UvrB [Phycisphaerae bacterium]|nr:excinuclease ABC subunit UvrB [Phycisphaerae bacterium]